MALMQYDDIIPYFEKPEGSIGTIIAQHMNEEYASLNQWAVHKLDLQKNDKILEIGFGTGMAIHQMSELVTRGLITGIDFSELMLQQANMRNAEAVAQGRVVLQMGDIQALPEFDQQFDKILAVNNMMYWKNPDLVLKNLSKYLKPAGSISVFWQRGPEYIASQQGQDEIKWYIQTIKSAGFVPVLFFQPITRLYRCIQALDADLDRIDHSHPFPVYGICIQAYKRPICNDFMSLCKALIDLIKITTNMLRQDSLHKEKSYLPASYV